MNTNTINLDQLPVEYAKTSTLRVGDIIREGNRFGGYLYWTITSIATEQSAAGAKVWRIARTESRGPGNIYGASASFVRVIK